MGGDRSWLRLHAILNPGLVCFDCKADTRKLESLRFRYFSFQSSSHLNGFVHDRHRVPRRSTSHKPYDPGPGTWVQVSFSNEHQPRIAHYLLRLF